MKNLCVLLFLSLFTYLFMYPTIRFFRYNRPSSISQPDTELLQQLIITLELRSTYKKPESEIPLLS